MKLFKSVNLMKRWTKLSYHGTYTDSFQCSHQARQHVYAKRQRGRFSKRLCRGHYRGPEKFRHLSSPWPSMTASYYILCYYVCKYSKYVTYLFKLVFQLNLLTGNMEAAMQDFEQSVSLNPNFAIAQVQKKFAGTKKLCQFYIQVTHCPCLLYLFL